MRLGVVTILPKALKASVDPQGNETQTLGLAGGGVISMIPEDFRAFTPENLAPIAEHGFTGFGHYFGGDPAKVTEKECEQSRRVWESLGLNLAQFFLLYRECLFDPDRTVRRAVIDKIKSGNRMVRWMHGGAHLLRPGSLNPAGSWTPHPDNHTPESMDRFVESLREIGADAEANGVTVVVECHVVSIMRSPDVCAEVVERVGSPSIRLVMDPVNHFESIHQAFNGARHLHYMFDVLGQISPIGHAKDLHVGNELVTHLDETAPGEGVLDYVTFLTRFQEFNPDGYLLIEHIPLDRIPAAVAYIRRMADQAGVEIH